MELTSLHLPSPRRRVFSWASLGRYQIYQNMVAGPQIFTHPIAAYELPCKTHFLADENKKLVTCRRPAWLGPWLIRRHMYLQRDHIILSTYFSCDPTRGSLLPWPPLSRHLHNNPDRIHSFEFPTTAFAVLYLRTNSPAPR